MAGKKKRGHVRVHCPHCSREVAVQQPQGFARAMPCPSCRRPISADVISAAAEAFSEAQESDES